MKYRVPVLVALAMSALAGCFQTIDNGVIAGGPQDSIATGGDAAPATATGNGLPAPFADADLSQQCEAGSALCSEICQSPECATQNDAGVPILVPTIQTPGILLPEGGSTQDPCVELEAQSMVIRTRSCAGCHGPPPAKGFSGFNYVLDDQQLVGATVPAGATTVTMVLPGDPTDSYVWERMSVGVGTPTSPLAMPPSPSSCTATGASNSVCMAIVYPSAEDVSVMYAWILNWAGGGDGGAFASRYYGGDYGPGGDAGQLATQGSGGGGTDGGTDGP